MVTFFVIVMVCVSLPLILAITSYDENKRHDYLEQMRNKALWKKLVDKYGKKE